ncbi:hypothetical protein JX266_006560 [Neoarthrinium moseri]|nr:hypothetical protein JX266_006560 [Neoarthrinium moseri]
MTLEPGLASDPSMDVCPGVRWVELGAKVPSVFFDPPDRAYPAPSAPAFDDYHLPKFPFYQRNSRRAPLSHRHIVLRQPSCSKPLNPGDTCSPLADHKYHERVILLVVVFAATESSGRPFPPVEALVFFGTITPWGFHEDINRLQKFLQDVDARLLKQEETLSSIKLAVNDAQEKLSSGESRFRGMQDHHKAIEMQLNTFQNGHKGLESRLEKHVAILEERLSDQDAIQPPNPQLSPEDAQVLELFKTYQSHLAELMSLVDSPEKIEFLKKSITRRGSEEDTAKTPTVSSLTTPGANRFHMEPPAPDAAFTAVPFPRAMDRFRRWLEAFADRYEDQPPRFEHHFISSLMIGQRRLVADFVQQIILDKCRSAKRCPLSQPQGQNAVTLFVDFKTVTWPQVFDALTNAEYAPLIERLQEEEALRAREKARRNERTRKLVTAGPLFSTDVLWKPSSWVGAADPEL